jgi:hypothetical protein
MRAGRVASEINGLPPGTPPTSEFSIFPRTSEASAPRRVTVAPCPGTSSPWAASGERKTGAVSGTTITAA